MLSFEVTAIDLILVISVIVLLILHMTKTSPKKSEDDYDKHSIEKKEFVGGFGNQLSKVFNSFRKHSNNESSLVLQSSRELCPRGFGSIKKLRNDNSVSDKCLGCYNIIECYNVDKFEK